MHGLKVESSAYDCTYVITRARGWSGKVIVKIYFLNLQSTRFCVLSKMEKKSGITD